ncbi:ribonuclease III [Gammaproteobacteria bacterium 45_16_T64]|nr:ribonuclease III [Gammaproteobacteria bacterium 45_16_T64]
MKPEFDSLYTILGYTFNDELLLQLALTHRSVSGSNNNERLEFLGDSVLSTIVGEAVFERFPSAREGTLSRMRASLVNGVSLAQLARTFTLSEHLILGPGELKSGGKRRDSILEDAVEAIIGAIYQDSNFDTCRSIVLNWFQSHFEALTDDGAVKDNKSRLQEFLQSEKVSLPAYDIVSIEGKSHNQSFTIACNIVGADEPYIGIAGSRRQAEQIAAGKALKHFSTR